MTTPHTHSADELARRYVALMQAPGMIRNLTTTLDLIEFAGHSIPISVNDFQPKNCWTVSPTTMMIHYALDELPKLDSRALRGLLRLLSVVAEWPLRLARIDRLQILNNPCLSTNVYGECWRDLDLAALRQVAIARQPRHGLALRSVNARQQPELLARARADGWLPVVTRQVYLYADRERWWGRSGSRTDDRLLRQPGWDMRELDPDDAAQMARAEHLYTQLYLEKYSMHNVQFTAAWLGACSRAGVIRLWGLYHGDELLGTVGMFGVDGVTTAPIVGYDTTQPRKLALYRRLIAHATRYAMDHGLILNLSAGAPYFKRLRGGEPEIEYMLIYTRHLGLGTRAAWRLISWLSLTVYRSLLRRYEL